MATSQNFNGKDIFEPGSYSGTKSGVSNPTPSATSGNILIIDTGLGSAYGAGSGVNGQLKAGKEAVEYYSSYEEYVAAVNGGFLGLLGQPLFRPSKNRTAQGVRGVYFIKAATTTAATLAVPLATGGVLALTTRNEGTCGNGVVTNSVLTAGYAVRLRKASQDASLYIVDFFRGTFSGLDSTGEPYDNIAIELAKPVLLVSSPAVATTLQLGNWMARDGIFNAYFKGTATVAGTGALVAADLTTYAAYSLFTGGSSTYGPTDLDATLDSIGDLDYTFVLAPEADPISLNNTKIWQHLVTEARFQKYIVAAGGNAVGDAAASIAAAQYYNSARAVVVHGACGRKRRGIAGFKIYPSLYTAALVLGRTCGIAPQTPLTYKDLDMDYIVHDLKPRERKKFLDVGVLHIKKDDDGTFVVNEGINTLQVNTNLVNDDGTSHLISVERISAQLNKEIELESKRVFLKRDQGPNRFTVAPEVYAQWLKNYLSARTADKVTDNLLLSFSAVSAIIQADSIKAVYSFEPNFEVNKILTTGFIIDRS